MNEFEMMRNKTLSYINQSGKYDTTLFNRVRIKIILNRGEGQYAIQCQTLWGRQSFFDITSNC